MNICFIFADKPHELNTSIYRIILPAYGISKLPEKHKVSMMPIDLFVKGGNDVDLAVNDADIIVIERNFFGDVLYKMINLYMQGKIIVTNFDDAYHAVTPTNPSYTFWNEGKIKLNENDKLVDKYIYPHPFEQFRRGISISHAMTLPSFYLGDYYQGITGTPFYYVRNYFETKNYPYIKRPKNKKEFIIGWGGSLSHYESFVNSSVIPALEKIVKERDNVKVCIVGDKRVYDKLPFEQKMFKNYVKNEEWGTMLANTFDIGIAPLSGEYDKYRSDIKVIEYLLTGKPFAYTNLPPYKDIKNKGGIPVGSNMNSWYDTLSEILDTYDEKVQSILDNFDKDSVDIYKQAQSIVDTYEKIIKTEGRKGYNNADLFID
jgi:hypothetical protein